MPYRMPASTAVAGLLGLAFAGNVHFSAYTFEAGPGKIAVSPLRGHGERRNC